MFFDSGLRESQNASNEKQFWFLELVQSSCRRKLILKMFQSTEEKNICEVAAVLACNCGFNTTLILFASLVEAT